jgi:hypothetical protein
MDYNNSFNQVMIYQTFCLVPKPRLVSISFREFVLIVDASYDNSRLGYRAKDKQLTSYYTMDQYFVVYTVRFSVFYLRLRADFLECIYIRIVPDFLSCGILAMVCSYIRLYCSSRPAKEI